MHGTSKIIDTFETYQVLPRPTCHSDRCSAVRGGSSFGSQSSVAMVLPWFVGSWCLPLLLRAAFAAEDDGGICRRFNNSTFLGSVCNFLVSGVFLVVVVDRVASLASSLDIPRMYAFLVLGVLHV